MPVIKPAKFLLRTAALSLLLPCATWAAGYKHSLTVDKMTFDWSVEGANLLVKISAPTKGWVGIGFNPTDEMKDANIILGYVKNGKVEIEDDFGTQPTVHLADTMKGGKSDVTVLGGTETGDTTTLEFSIPLNSGEPTDPAIDPEADTVVILAHGPNIDSFRMKHQFSAKITVNLESGAKK